MRDGRTLLVVAVAAGVAAAACDRSPTSVPAGEEFELAALTVPTGSAFNVVVCKEGPAGSYDFTVTANTGSVTLPLGGSFSLSADQCATVATATDNLQSVTVVEQTPPPGTLFSSVDVYRYFNGVQTLNRTETDASVDVSPVGEDLGWVLVYKNEAEPPPPVDGRMTGGGSVFMGEVRFTHGFELHCDVDDLPNNLEVNWPDNRFHLTELTSVVCTDDPALHPLPRRAGFDTYTATGVGLWNGQPGATIEFVFTDDGEPGRRDYAMMTITPAGGSPVTVDGYLFKGNHQAHWVR